MKVIAKSKSGKTYVILNEDNTIGLNNVFPIMTLGQLKGLRENPNFRQGFLARISDEFLKDIDPEPFTLPGKVFARAIERGKGIRESLRTWYLIDNGAPKYSQCFIETFANGTIAFVNNCIATQDFEFVPDRFNEMDEEEFIAAYEKELAERAERDAEAHQVWMLEMNKKVHGWYVVTFDVLVSRIRGNDGRKTCSFRVLADSQMDAYEKARNIVMTDGVKDSNVSFVYDVVDSAKSAFIEYVGVWTDESELEYGPVR